MIKNLSYKKEVLFWILSFFIVVLSFPYYEPDFGIGLDSSYTWGLNWLFCYDYDTLKQLTYPLGPLFVLKAPTTECNNFLLFLITNGFFKIIFIYSLLKLSNLYQIHWLKAMIIVIILTIIINFDLMMIGLCICFQLFFYHKKTSIFFLFSVFIGLIGLFVKASIGICSCSIIFISWLYVTIQTKAYRKAIQQIIGAVLIGLIMGLIVFGDFKTLFEYLFGIIHLSFGYSDSMALYPENNWWLLSIFILSILVFPFIIKDQNAKFSFFISVFALFLMWKHGMVREDFSHYKLLILFVIAFWCFILLVSKRQLILILCFAIVSVVTINFNKNIMEHKPIDFHILNIKNTYRSLCDYTNFKNSFEEKSNINIHGNKLNDDDLLLIGEATVDVYPWEFTYIAANNLHWKPRQTVEIGASTSQWASDKASQNFLLNHKSPEFVLFHFVNDKYLGRFGSIDGRYIFNDEPLVIYNILNNYKIVKISDRLMFLQKSNKHQINSVEVGEKLIQNFDQWIDIPKFENKIVRMKFVSKNNLLGKIKKFLYKEEAYFIDYMIDNDIIYSYRFIPTTAIDGLWCSPLLGNAPNQQVQKVRIRNSNSLFISNQFTIQFEYLLMNDSTNVNILKTI